jgi:hypothetical protein
LISILNNTHSHMMTNKELAAVICLQSACRTWLARQLVYRGSECNIPLVIYV